jgi:membrane-associated phospholipid phosphatase
MNPSACGLRLTRHGGRGSILPRGRADFVRQVVIWFGFVFAYELARGLADRGSALALSNGHGILEVERDLHAAFESWLQQDVLSVGGLLVDAVNVTYWLSQFAVVGLALLWIYLRRNEAFLRVRDTVIIANTLGLVGYVLVPTAPPRLLRGHGVVDTFSGSALSHTSDLVQLAANPYAAMPSLHAADAIIVGGSLALLVRPLWLKLVCVAWPVWVAFALIASGNHFWLDIAAGAALVAVAVPIASWRARRLASGGCGRTTVSPFASAE